MLCEKCNADTGVKDTRYSRIEKEFRFVIRVRKCDNEKCEHQFRTIEVERDHYRELVAQEENFTTDQEWQDRFDELEDQFNEVTNELTERYKADVSELKNTIKELKKKKQINFTPSKEKPKQPKDLYSYDDYDQEENWEIENIKRNTRLD